VAQFSQASSAFVAQTTRLRIGRCCGTGVQEQRLPGSCSTFSIASALMRSASFVGQYVTMSR